MVKWFPRVRKTWQSFVWKMVYAGRVMEVNRVPFSVARRQADEAATLYGTDGNPKQLADTRMRLYRK